MHLLKPAALALALLISALLLAPAHAQAGDRGKLYIVGMGPAGPLTATMQALQTVKDVDALIVSGLLQELFAKEVKGKAILFDHIAGLWDYKGRFFTSLPPKDLPKYKQERDRLTKERITIINDYLAQGKDLAMLEGGNPMVFSSSHWYAERLDSKDLVFIPGMGSAAAAMAAVGKSVIPAYGARFLLQSSPFTITDENQPDAKMLKALAPFQPTMIFYMALKNSKLFLAALAQAFSPQTPCAVVFCAGYPDKQEVLRSTLGELPKRLSEKKERYLGLLMVGDFVNGKPYLSAEQ